MKLRWGWAIGVLAVAACTGSNATEPPTVSAPLTTPPPTTTTTPPATTTTTTTTTTTVAPSTTVADEVLFAAAEEAYEAAQHAYIEVLRDPQNPDNDERLAQHFAGDNLENARKNLQLALDGPFVARPNPDNPNLIRFVLEPSFRENRRDEIELGVCVFGSDRFYELGAGPNGEDVLIEDDPVSIQKFVVMKLVDGQWKSFSGGPASEIHDEQEQCTRQ